MLNLRALIVALIVALAGCATPDSAPDRPPSVPIAQSTWRQVDRDMVVASQAATGQAEDYARNAMERWRGFIYQRTDADFIPWFSSYWTQQWLTLKVAWYRLNAGSEAEPPVNRLATYLQEQYHERVLEPVAKEIDPERIMGQATQVYVQRLGEQCQGIAQRYGIPHEQFEQRLKGVPAIALTDSPAHSASLYQLLHTAPVDRLPAYAALVDQVRHATGGVAAGSSTSGLASVAERTSAQLEAELTTSGAASAASAMVGRVAGTLISLGVAGFNAIARENGRPEMERRLRENLNVAFDEEWFKLMENRTAGVLAGVYYLSGQIERSLGGTAALPVEFDWTPRATIRPGGQPLHDETLPDTGSGQPAGSAQGW
ncbi:hypothetical protein HP532_19130 [Pseudomonas sp. CrR25]|nr:hypothetical protein [Pseudomonas sp. CrR25]